MATQPQQQPQQQQPPLLSGQIQALAREAAKDSNNTLQEVFFGKQAGMTRLEPAVAKKLSR